MKKIKIAPPELGKKEKTKKLPKRWTSYVRCYKRKNI